MTFLIYFLLLIPFSLVTTALSYFLGIYLGAIPTIALYSLYFYFADKLNISWKKHVFYKEAEENGLSAYDYLCTKIPENIIKKSELLSSSTTKLKQYFNNLKKAKKINRVYMSILEELYFFDEEEEKVKLHKPQESKDKTNSHTPISPFTEPNKIEADEVPKEKKVVENNEVTLTKKRFAVFNKNSVQGEIELELVTLCKKMNMQQKVKLLTYAYDLLEK